MSLFQSSTRTSTTGRKEPEMRIAMITDSYRPTMDGVVTALLAQKRALEDLGHAVFIIAPDPGEKDREEGVYYLKAKRFKSYPDYFIPLYRSRVKKIIRELDVDIIQIYGVAFMALKAMLVSHSLKIPTVLTYVTNVTDVMDFYSPLKILPLKTQKKLVWIYLRNLLKRPNRLVLLTPESQRDMEQHNVHARKIEILPMCIDVERFRPGFDGDEIRRRYGLEDKRVVINVGRMSYEKNLPQVIDAMRFMPEDVMLLSVGSGPAFDDVKKHAEEVGLMDRVIFTGFVPNEVLAQYYCAADCVVSASRFETQGLTIVEAMACGIPASRSINFPIPRVDTNVMSRCVLTMRGSTRTATACPTAGSSTWGRAR